MSPDPYSNLAGALLGAKQKYLRSLCAVDESAQPARGRGYLIVPGNLVNGDNHVRPTATPDEVTAANNAQTNDQAFWEDTPALRSVLGDPLQSDDIQWATARLTAATLTQGDAAPLVFPPDFVTSMHIPALDDFAHGRTILDLSYKIGLQVNLSSNVQDWLRDSILSPSGIFDDQGLLGRVRSSFDSPPPGVFTPQPDTVTIQLLTQFTVDDEDDPIASDRAALLLNRISTFLGSDTDRDLYYDFEEALILYLETRLGDDTSGTLPKEAWQALDWLGWLGGAGEQYFQVRWVDFGQRLPRAANVSTDESVFAQAQQNPFIIPWLLMRPNVQLPADWVWPDFTAEGIYWWRSVIFAHCIQHMLSYKDTADFHATDLLHFAYLFHLFDNQKDSRIPDYVVSAIKSTLLNFKYWFNEKPESDREQEIKNNSFDNEMTFWSENHQINFYQAQYLAGSLFPNETFIHASASQSSPVTGATLKQNALPRLRTWLNQRLAFGFSEWNSPGYYDEDFPPLFNLADFCDDSEIQTKASMALDRLIFDFARFTCHGSFGVSAGRAYFEHKCYGWEQSAGNAIEILFGTRGDFMAMENTALYLAVSNYEVPPALLAIGLDRIYQDPQEPLIDNTRISINLDEAGQYGIGFSSETDALTWWSREAYFTDDTLEVTRAIVEAHDNLKHTNPFKILYPDPSGSFWAALVSVILDLVKTPIVGDVTETAAGAALQSVAGTGVLLPFPLNILAGGLAVAGIEMELTGIISFVGDLIKTGVRAIEKLFGGGDDNQPVVPQSSVISFLEQLVKTFNEGSVLSRINQYTYSNGDAMLSSIQNHLPGKIAFQKHPWEATLDCEACVWTTASLANLTSSFGTMTDTILSAWLEFFKDLGEFKPLTALVGGLAAPVVPATGIFGHDGPNYWTGTFALPMVVQHENAAIIAYNLPNFQRALGAAQTHAWFPKQMFNEVSLKDMDSGTWVFGRKNSGYVALYSARKVSFTTTDPWTDKELIAEGSTNVWVCVVGSESQYGDFSTFMDQVSGSYLHVSGIDSVVQIECSFDVPGATAPPGRSPRLELFYSDGVGRFAGDDLTLDNFPRFDNKYVQSKWDDTSYTLTHPQTGLTLMHDLSTPRRDFSRQITLQVNKDPFKRPVFKPFRLQMRDAKAKALKP